MTRRGDLTPLDDAILAKLEDPTASVEECADVIASLPEAGGQLPTLRLDLTDPPSLPTAWACGIAATGATADQAVKSLARAVAGHVRAADVERKRLAAELAATKELVSALTDTIFGETEPSSPAQLVADAQADWAKV